MFSDPEGPIIDFSWGKFTIKDVERLIVDDAISVIEKDVRIVNGKAKNWKTRKGHKLTLEMLGHIIEKDINVLIIGNGVFSALEIPESIINDIHRHGIPNIYVKNTP